jgi:hypothetical protein
MTAKTARIETLVAELDTCTTSAMFSCVAESLTAACTTCELCSIASDLVYDSMRLATGNRRADSRISARTWLTVATLFERCEGTGGPFGAPHPIGGRHANQATEAAHRSCQHQRQGYRIGCVPRQAGDVARASVSPDVLGRQKPEPETEPEAEDDVWAIARRAKASSQSA